MNFHEACVVIPRNFHLDQKIIQLLPRKIGLRRKTIGTIDEHMTTIDENVDEAQISPGPSKISHRRKTFSSSIFMPVKNVPFSNYKPKQ